MSQPTVGSCWVTAIVDSKGLYLDCASSEAVWTVGLLLVKKAEPTGEGGKGEEGLQVGRKGPQAGGQKSIICPWKEH